MVYNQDFYIQIATFGQVLFTEGDLFNKQFYVVQFS